MSVNNNSKRKARPPTNSNSKPPRVKGLPERMSTFEGVYGNARFMHAAASLVGCIVHLRVKNGTIYEGVFTTFSQQLDIVLEMVHRLESKKQTSTGVSSLLASYRAEDAVCEKMIFRQSDIVTISAACIDPEFATRDGKKSNDIDGFTDISISKYNGPLPERELEPWDAPVEDGEGVIVLEGDEEKNGWDVHEMFRTNAEKYNVKSTYDSSMPEYTIQLEPKNTDEYKKAEAKASKLANEIESSPAYRNRTNLENGDEEERFSAVLRPVDNSNLNKYSARKRNIPGGKTVRSTPPPTSLHHSSGPKGQHYPLHSPGSTPTHNYNNNKMLPNSLPPPHNHTMHGRPGSPRGPPPASMTLPMPPPAHISQAQITIQDNYADDSLHKDDGREDAKLSPNEDSVHMVCNTTGKTGDRRDLPPKPIPPRGRDEQIAEFKKFSSDFKLSEDPKSGPKDSSPRDDECDSFGSTNGEASSGSKDDEMSKDGSLEGDRGTPTLSPCEGDDKGSALKKSTLNPNAKAFTPRSVPVASPPTMGVSVPPPRLHTQSPIMAVPQQLMTGLAQPLFTAMGPQYVMSATPGSMALTPPFATTTVTPTHRFRKDAGMSDYGDVRRSSQLALLLPMSSANSQAIFTLPMTVQPRHDFSQSVHVAAATGQPILAPAGIPTPPQLAMQYTHTHQGMVPTHGHHHHHHQVAYQQVMYPVQMGPRVMSPPSVSLVPTSHSGSYGEPHPIQAQVFMSPHPGAALSASHTVSVSALAANMVPPPPQGPSGGPHSAPSTPGQPPNQSQVSMHTAPSPVHQQPQVPPSPTQTPTPTGGHPVSTSQPVVYHSQLQHATGPPQHGVPPSSQQILSHQHFAAAVLMHQQAAHAAAQAAAQAAASGSHGPHGGSMPSNTHSLQGLQGGPPPSGGHMGTPTHVISHPTMVIPTSAAMVHANPFAPHPHQARDRGRQHTGNR